MSCSLHCVVDGVGLKTSHFVVYRMGFSHFSEMDHVK